MKTMEELMKIFAANGRITAAELELTALSYPVPGQVDGKLVERFFLSSNQAKAVRPRPHAWLEIDSENGRLLRYLHCTAQDFAAGLNVPLGETVDYGAPGEGSYRERMAIKREFSQQYEEIRGFAFAEALDPAQQEKLQRYTELQGQVIGPQLLGYYKALSPEFFQWLDKMSQ